METFIDFSSPPHIILLETAIGIENSPLFLFHSKHTNLNSFFFFLPFYPFLGIFWEIFSQAMETEATAGEVESQGDYEVQLCGNRIGWAIYLGSDPPPQGWDADSSLSGWHGLQFTFLFGLWGNPKQKTLQFVTGILGPGGVRSNAFEVGGSHLSFLSNDCEWFKINYSIVIRVC